MKITFTVTDLGEARLLTNAGRYKRVLVDFDEYLRRGIKYHEKPWQEIRDQLYSLVREWEVTLEDDYEPTEESCSGGCACGRATDSDGNGRDGDDDPMATGVGR